MLRWCVCLYHRPGLCICLQSMMRSVCMSVVRVVVCGGGHMYILHCMWGHADSA